MNELIDSEKQFWNSDEIVNLFSDKKPSRYLDQYLSDNSIEEFKVLDHGCGAGRNSDLLAEKGADVYCVDVNPAMVEQTIETLGNYYGENSSDRVKQSHIVDLPYNDNEFQLVVSMGVLHQAHNLKDLKTSINEISRVIKKEGDVILEVFTNEFLSRDFEIKEEYESAVTVRTSEKLPMTLLSEKKLLKLMRDSGFELIDSKSYKKELKTGVRSIFSATFRKVE